MILLSYLFYFLASTAAPIQRRWLSKRNEGGDKINLSFKVTFVRGVLVLLLPIFVPFELKGSYTTIILLLFAAAISGAGYFVSYFTAQRHVEAGVTSVLQNVYTPLTIVLSTIFLGEGLAGLQIIGTILLIVAAVIVSKKHHIGRISFDKYFWLMIFSGVSLSGLLVANRELMKITGFTASTVMNFWTVCLVLGILSSFTKGKTTYSSKDIIVTGSLGFLQDFSWAVLTFFVANLSLVSSITTFKIVVMFIVAAALLGEKEDWQRKTIGSLVAVAGLLLMR